MGRNLATDNSPAESLQQGFTVPYMNSAPADFLGLRQLSKSTFSVKVHTESS